MIMKKYETTEKARNYGKEILKKYDYVYDFKTRFGFVYLVVADFGCKIGITSDINTRIRTISSGIIKGKVTEVYVSELCENSREVEKCFKNNFENQRINNEWYCLDMIGEYLKYLEEQKVVFNNPTLDEENKIRERANVRITEISRYFSGF